jgi:hypothetical protein
MIRTFAAIAIVTAAIAGSQLSSADAASTIYKGSANGGVWKTADGGSSWSMTGEVTEARGLLLPAIQKVN